MIYIGTLKYSDKNYYDKAIIKKEKDNTYSVEVNRIYDDNSKQLIIGRGIWANNLTWAKRRITIDTNLKTSDFKWEVITNDI